MSKGRILGADGKPIGDLNVIADTAKTAVPDMRAEAIDKRQYDTDRVQETKDQMQAAMDKWMKMVNPFITNAKPQHLSEYGCLHNLVLIEPHIVREKVGSIIMSEADKDEQEKVTNSALAYKVVKIGPEVVSVRVGDYVFKGKPQPGYLTPLIEDTEGGDGQVHGYESLPENWCTGLLRKDLNEEDLKPSPMPKSEIQSA